MPDFQGEFFFLSFFSFFFFLSDFQDQKLGRGTPDVNEPIDLPLFFSAVVANPPRVAKGGVLPVGSHLVRARNPSYSRRSGENVG